MPKASLHVLHLDLLDLIWADELVLEELLYPGVEHLHDVDKAQHGVGLGLVVAFLEYLCTFIAWQLGIFLEIFFPTFETFSTYYQKKGRTEGKEGRRGCRTILFLLPKSMFDFLSHVQSFLLAKFLWLV